MMAPGEIIERASFGIDMGHFLNHLFLLPQQRLPFNGRYRSG